MPAYALYTDACIAAMGVDPVALGLARYIEPSTMTGDVIAGSATSSGMARGAASCVAPSSRSGTPGYVLEALQPHATSSGRS